MKAVRDKVIPESTKEQRRKLWGIATRKLDVLAREMPPVKHMEEVIRANGVTSEVFPLLKGLVAWNEVRTLVQPSDED